MSSPSSDASSDDSASSGTIVRKSKNKRDNKLLEKNTKILEKKVNNIDGAMTSQNEQLEKIQEDLSTSQSVTEKSLSQIKKNAAQTDKQMHSNHEDTKKQTNETIKAITKLSADLEIIKVKISLPSTKVTDEQNIASMTDLSDLESKVCTEIKIDLADRQSKMDTQTQDNLTKVKTCLTEMETKVTSEFNSSFSIIQDSFNSQIVQNVTKFEEMNSQLSEIKQILGSLIPAKIQPLADQSSQPANQLSTDLTSVVNNQLNHTNYTNQAQLSESDYTDDAKDETSQQMEVIETHYTPLIQIIKSEILPENKTEEEEEIETEDNKNEINSIDNTENEINSTKDMDKIDDNEERINLIKSSSIKSKISKKTSKKNTKQSSKKKREITPSKTKPSKTNIIMKTFKLMSSLSTVPMILQILGIWLLILAANGQVNASLTQNSKVQINIGDQPQPNQLYNPPMLNASYALYEVNHFGTQNYQIPLKDLTSDIILELEANCHMIHIWNQRCVNNSKNCQIADEMKQTSETAVTALTQTLFSMAQICDLPEYSSSTEAIKRCNKGQSWTTQEIQDKFPFLDNMMEYLHNSLSRQKRFVFSTPILIATAVGTLISTAASMAAAVSVAESESKRVSARMYAIRKTDREDAIQNNLLNNLISKSLGHITDDLRYNNALSAQTANNLQNAISLGGQIQHLFSTNELLQFGDPETERYYSAIEGFVKSGIPGFTSKEYRETTRLTSGVTTLTTSLIPMTPGSMDCKDIMMTKTLLVPVIKARSTLMMSNGTITPKDNKNSTYTLFSEDTVISQATNLFGRQIVVIGRKCTVDSSIQAKSTPTGNYLFDQFEFFFSGQVNITETCLSEDGLITEQWSFNETAHIRLPISCSLQSQLISCGSVPLHHSEAKQIKLANHRMSVILRTDEDEIHAALYASNYTQSPDSEKEEVTGWNRKFSGLKPHLWIIIGSSGLIALAATMLILRKATNHAGTTKNEPAQTSVNVITTQYNNPPPTVPQSTAAHAGTSPIRSQFTMETEDGPPGYKETQHPDVIDRIRRERQRSIRFKT